MIRTSRSKIVARFHCPRYRYLKYHFGGKGLERKGAHSAAGIGLAIHLGNALVLTGTDVDEAVRKALLELSVNTETPKGPHAGQILLEGQYLVEGTIRAFNRVRVPQLRAMGDIIRVESEHPIQLAPDIIYDFRPDVLIRTEEGLYIIDWKPAPDGGPVWVASWERSHQVLAYVWAANQLGLDEPVMGMKIEGYVKGRRRWDENYGRKIQNTPLCYVYENDYNGMIVPDYQRSNGWDKVPLWETSFSSKEWVEDVLTSRQVEGHFLAPVPEICPTPRQLEQWRRQTHHGEHIAEANALLVEIIRSRDDYEAWVNAMDASFPQNHDSCRKYGSDYPCEFDGPCHSEQQLETLHENEDFTERVDHHLQEDSDE